MEAFRARILRMFEERERQVRAADNLLLKLTTMKIDGWFDNEYDLPDQQDVMKATREYFRVRYPKRKKRDD
jgi:IS4 transposase